MKKQIKERKLKSRERIKRKVIKEGKVNITEKKDLQRTEKNILEKIDQTAIADDVREIVNQSIREMFGEIILEESLLPKLEKLLSYRKKSVEDDLFYAFERMCEATNETKVKSDIKPLVNEGVIEMFEDDFSLKLTNKKRA